MVTKRAKRPKPSPPLDARKQARIASSLGKTKTAEQVAKSHGVTLSQVRYVATRAGVSTLRGSKKQPPKPVAEKSGGIKVPGKRGRPRQGQLVAAAAIRPAISKTCESCSFLLGIIRDLVGRLRPRGLLGAKR